MGYMQQAGLDCQRDEYPPLVFWQDQDLSEQWIRMVRQSPIGGMLKHRTWLSL